MRKAVRLLWLLTVALASSVQAGEFKIGGVAIDVPANFAGPTSTRPDEHVQSHAFTALATSPLLPSTVLQITVYDTVADAHAGHSADVAQRHLSQMLEGIKRRRTEYRESAVKMIRLAGMLGSVASWQGKANGTGINGKMYCIITESGPLFFHVMGGGSAPNADMAAAIKAVESARKY